MHTTSARIIQCAILLIVFFSALVALLLAFKHALIRADLDKDMILTVGTLWCCGRGIEGNQGLCILGTADSICCSGEIPLICSAHSSCHINDNGHPYCCGKGTTGCNNICVFPTTERLVRSRGGTCNRVAPQGLKTPGRVQYVDAPWDPIAQRYQFRDRAIQMYQPPIILGTDDFTVTVTITPRKNFSIGVQEENSGTRSFYHRLSSNGLGFRFGFADFHLIDAIFVEMDLVGPTAVANSTCTKQLVSGLVTPGWRQGVPVNFKWVRQNFSLFIFANDTQIVNRTENCILDVDTGLGLSVPFEIGPLFNHEKDVVAVDAYASDLSFLNTVEFPPR